MKRMWINQPSTLQPRHSLHGRRVLAVEECPGTYRCYFTEGDLISTQIDSMALSDGWPAAPVPEDWRQRLLAEFPLLDDNGLEEGRHHCEWTLQQERKRLHAMLAASEQECLP